METMLNRLSSRGPDANGMFSDGSVILGHTLLQILPCPNSRQPLSSPCGRYAISFNGEIYNYRKLRGDLIADGYQFRTDTDTEVILTLFARDGVQAFAQLNGMFAIVIYDSLTRELILARDRFGQKPLYVYRGEQSYVVASTIRAIASAIDEPLTLNKDVLPFYFTLGQTPHETTLFSRVEHIPPGYAYILAPGNKWKGKVCFRTASFDPLLSTDHHHAFRDEDFAGLFKTAVNEMADTVHAPSAHLSGGLDSGCIAICLKEAFPELSTYSCVYRMDSWGIDHDELMFDERPNQQAIIQHAGLNNAVISIDPRDYLTQIVTLMHTLEEPKGNPCMPHFMLSQHIASRHRIVFSGEGADELFGGYPWKFQYYRNPSHDEYINGLYRTFSLLPNSAELMEIIQPTPVFSAPDVYDYFRGHFTAQTPDRRLADVLNYDIKHFLHYLLLQADKLYANSAMEGRYPFLHDAIVDFAFQHSLQSIAHDTARRGKPIIRTLATNMISPHIGNADKIGFVPPEGGYYRGGLFALTQAFLLDSQSEVSNILGHQTVSRILNAHSNQGVNCRKLIWAMLAFETWHRYVY